MSTPESERTLAEDLLARAAEDWVSAAEVIDLVRRSGITDPSTLRDLAIGLIARLLAEGLVVAGDIDRSEHAPWPLSEGEAMFRIASQWTAEEDPFVMPGSIVWLDTTAQGQVIAESIWRREGRV